MPISDFEKGEYFLTFATAGGQIKRTALHQYRNVNRSGLIAINLNDGDELVGAVWTSGHDHILLGTEEGMAIRFKEDDARPMGRATAGVRGIALKEGNRVVGLVKVEMSPPDEDGAQQPLRDAALLTVTESGYGKRTDLNEYLVTSEADDGTITRRTQSRGGKGRIDIRTTARNGKVVAVRAVSPDEDVMLITQKGMLVRIPADSISHIGRATQGVRVINLKSGDRLISAARIMEKDSDESEPSA
jgi:DNA gyrase subunit A